MSIELVLLRICFAVLLLPLSLYAQTFSPAHSGSTDPLTEGFATLSFAESVATGPVTNDTGFDAWEINSLTTASQFTYVSSAFSAAEKSQMAANGFSVLFTGQVLQGSAASIYTPLTPYVLSAVGIDTGTRRYQVFLGLDANGDTVAVLPTSINNAGAGGRLRAPGPSYTLNGLGAGYHNYRLVFDPVAQLASLYIDGELRLSNYSGYDSFVTNHGLGFGGFSNSKARFAEVELILRAVPEPSVYALMIPGLLLVFASVRLSKRSEVKEA